MRRRERKTHPGRKTIVNWNSGRRVRSSFISGFLITGEVTLRLPVFRAELEMTRIFAIPLENLSKSQEFNKCSNFGIVAVENRVITGMNEFSTSVADAHYLSEWLKSKGVTDVLASDIDISTIQQLTSHNINAFLCVPEGDPLDLMQKFIDNRLSTLGYVCNQRAHHFFEQYWSI